MIQINEYSLLLIISFPTAKENLSRAVTPRHITTGILSAIKMTKESPKYFLCIAFNAFTNSKILNYKTMNFLVKKEVQSPYFYFVTSEIKRRTFPLAPTLQNHISERGYYFSDYIMLYFWAVLFNVWQGLPSLTSHWLSASYFDEFIFFSGQLQFIDDSNYCVHVVI